MTKHLHMLTPCSDAPKRSTPRTLWLLFAMFVACAGSFGFFGVNSSAAPLGQISRILSDTWQRDSFETRELMSRHLILRPSP